jgi:cysteine desulfurase
LAHTTLWNSADVEEYRIQAIPVANSPEVDSLYPMGAKPHVVQREPRSVYMDANATTPLLEEVFNEMVPWYFSRAGNASSGHTQGRAARAAIEVARQHVTDLIGCNRGELVFTSGGTEADNLAIFGTVTGPGVHIITTIVEHHAVLHPVERLEQLGCTATYLPVSEDGQVSTEDLRRALRPNTRLISVMMANNETGVLQPVEEIGRIARDRGILFHVDAVQAAGKVPVDVKKIGCDLLSISGHKMHASQGTGALFIREGVNLRSMLCGGEHELGRRAGTENLAGIVGFGKAAEIAKRGLYDGSVAKLKRLRDELERSLLRKIGDAGINGGPAPRVPNTANLWFGGVEGPRLLRQLDERGLSVSGGSACMAGRCQPSHVLSAMGLSMQKVSSSIRFSLSKQTTAEDVNFAIWQVSEAIEQLRAAASSGR